MLLDRRQALAGMIAAAAPFPWEAAMAAPDTSYSAVAMQLAARSVERATSRADASAQRPLADGAGHGRVALFELPGDLDAHRVAHFAGLDRRRRGAFDRERVDGIGDGRLEGRPLLDERDAAQRDPRQLGIKLGLGARIGIGLAARLRVELCRIIDVEEAVQKLRTVLPDLDEAWLRNRLTGDKGFVWLKRELTPAIEEQVMRLGIPGIDFITDTAANDAGGGPAGFTPREVKVTELIAKGHSNRAIADQLGISVKTVESHRASALRKAGVHTGPELVRFAIRHQLIA